MSIGFVDDDADDGGGYVLQYVDDGIYMCVKKSSPHFWRLESFFLFCFCFLLHCCC